MNAKERKEQTDWEEKCQQVYFALYFIFLWNIKTVMFGAFVIPILIQSS